MFAKNKKRTTMLASIAVVTLAATTLLLSGVVNMHLADADTSRFASTSKGEGSDVGSVARIIVEIESPFGFDRITSFKTFNTDNLMKKSGYHTLKLQGTIMDDKRTLLHWIGQDIGKMPDGLTAKVETHGAKPIQMTKPKDGATIDMIPMTGKVTLLLLENYMGMYDHHYTRQIEFAGCHVAGYHVGTLHDNDRPYLVENRLQHYEQVDFACKTVKDLQWKDMNNREVMVETAMGNEGRKIMNENGELIITSREYRQPIIMESRLPTESKQVNQEILTTIELDSTRYEIGNTATFVVTFEDIENNPIEPDTIRAFYDGKTIQLENQNTGIYTYTTPSLTKAHHQLIVSSEKTGFLTDTTYRSIPIQMIS